MPDTVLTSMSWARSATTKRDRSDRVRDRPKSPLEMGSAGRGPCSGSLSLICLRSYPWPLVEHGAARFRPTPVPLRLPFDDALVPPPSRPPRAARRVHGLDGRCAPRRIGMRERRERRAGGRCGRLRGLGCRRHIVRSLRREPVHGRLGAVSDGRELSRGPPVRGSNGMRRSLRDLVCVRGRSRRRKRRRSVSSLRGLHRRAQVRRGMRDRLRVELRGGRSHDDARGMPRGRCVDHRRCGQRLGLRPRRR